MGCRKYNDIRVSIATCRLMRRRIKVADPRIFLVSAAYIHIREEVVDDNNIMKGTKVQTLGARAVAGAWCMAGCLGHNYYGHGCNY